MTHQSLTQNLCQSTFGGLSVEGGQCLPCFPHDFNGIVKRYLVPSIPKQGVGAVVKRAHGSKGIAFDTGNLNQTAHRIARKS